MLADRAKEEHYDTRMHEEEEELYDEFADDLDTHHRGVHSWSSSSPSGGAGDSGRDNLCEGRKYKDGNGGKGGKRSAKAPVPKWGKGQMGKAPPAARSHTSRASDAHYMAHDDETSSDQAGYEDEDRAEEDSHETASWPLQPRPPKVPPPARVRSEPSRPLQPRPPKVPPPARVKSEPEPVSKAVRMIEQVEHIIEHDFKSIGLKKDQPKSFYATPVPWPDDDDDWDWTDVKYFVVKNKIHHVPNIVLKPPRSLCFKAACSPCRNLVCPHLASVTHKGPWSFCDGCRRGVQNSPALSDFVDRENAIWNDNGQTLPDGDGWIPELSQPFHTLLADQASVKPNGATWTTLVAEYWPWGESEGVAPALSKSSARKMRDKAEIDSQRASGRGLPVKTPSSDPSADEAAMGGAKGDKK